MHVVFVAVVTSVAPERVDQVVDGQEDEDGEDDDHHEEDADAPRLSRVILRLRPWPW